MKTLAALNLMLCDPTEKCRCNISVILNLFTMPANTDFLMLILEGVFRDQKFCSLQLYQCDVSTIKFHYRFPVYVGLNDIVPNRIQNYLF